MGRNVFDKSVCWVTGASSGIGASLAVALSKLGARVIISARNVANLEKVKSSCADPAKVTVLPFDQEDVGALPAVAKDAWMIHGSIDFAFLNAGFAVRDWVSKTDFEQIRKVMEVNFFGTIAITKALLPLMTGRQKGHFVVTGSLSGKYGIPKLSAYAASKHALHGFFESLRAEHARDGIDVTMIIPGLVKTDITMKALAGDGTVSGKRLQAVEEGISPNRCAKGILRATARNRNEALIGGFEVYSVVFKRFFPGLFTYIIRNNPLRRIRSLSFSRKES